MGGTSIFYTAPYMGNSYYTFAWCSSPWFNTWRVEQGHVGINNVHDSTNTTNSTYIVEFGY